MRANVYPLPACCGVKVIGEFGSGVDSKHLTKSFYDRAGTGYYISTFISSQQESYEAMCKQYSLVYQTEPKRNRYSGNQVFIAIFKEKR